MSTLKDNRAALARVPREVLEELAIQASGIMPLERFAAGKALLAELKKTDLDAIEALVRYIGNNVTDPLFDPTRVLALAQAASESLMRLRAAEEGSP